MLDKAFFMNLLKENNGIVQSKLLAEAGIDGKILQRLEQSGEIERIGRGLYSDSNHMADDYLVTQYLCKKGFYYQETALFLHDLSDQTPFQLILTIPNGFNTRLLRDKDKNKFFYIKKERHEIGKMTVTSPYGNEIVVYNKERTIGDCLQKKKSLTRI